MHLDIDAAEVGKRKPVDASLSRGFKRLLTTFKSAKNEVRSG